MIQAASKIKEQAKSSVHFTTEAPDKTFDFILVTYGLSNHLLSLEERVEVLKSFKRYMGPQSVLNFSGYYRPIKFGDRFFWASLILRLRWLFRRKWEPGLTVISHFGFHNDEAIPLPFYFYRHRHELTNELTLAGYQCHDVKTPEDHDLENYPNFFVCEKKD